MEKIEKTLVQVSKNGKKMHQDKLTKEVGWKAIESNILGKELPKSLQMVQTIEEEQEVYDLWESAYKEVYPDYKINRSDPHNAPAIPANL